MRSSAINVAVLSLLSTASAKTVRVDVGKSGLSFSPDSVTADKGDLVEFFFSQSIPHTVAEGDFTKGCAPVSGGFYSGQMTGSSSSEPAFAITVDSTDPIFFYCAIEGHCVSGMSGAINPSSDMSLASYQKTAAKSTLVVPSKVGGGQILKPGESPSASAPASSPPQSSGTASKSSGSGSATAPPSTSTGSSSGSSTSSAPSTVTSGGAATQLGNSAGGVVAAAAGLVAMLL